MDRITRRVFSSSSLSTNIRGMRRLAIQDDDYSKEEFDLSPRKNAYYYKYEIGKHARMGPPGLRRALELFHEMKSIARLTPSHQNFSPLFYGCAKAGYTKKAFELYEELLKYENKPSQSSINCLLNACAECPFPEYGLKRLEWFLTEIKVRHNIQMNLTQYNTAIKAYGKLGRLDEASKMIQRMIDQGLEPDLMTFHSLLIGCASDKLSGSSIALRVFKRIKMYNLKPTTITYRLLLRCIRDCDLGSREMILKTIHELPAVTSFDQRLEYGKRIPKKDKRFKQNFEWIPLLTDVGKSIAEAVKEPEISENVLEKTKYDNNHLKVSKEPDFDHPSNDSNESLVTDEEARTSLPNLLSDDHLDLMMRIKGLQVDKLKTRYDRLMLFGGLNGYIEAMLKDGCKPDEKALSLILLCLYPTKANFLQFFKLSQDLKVKRDVDLYDQLIWCICREFKDNNRLELALHFIEQLHIDNLRPTISTFEALALGCNKWIDAKKLMSELKMSNMVVSHGMIANFYESALNRRNYHFLTKLFDTSEKEHFKPAKHLIERLEALRVKTRALIAEQERGTTSVLPEAVVKDFNVYTKQLDKWLKRIDLSEEHPWEQFDVYDKPKNMGYIKFIEHMKAMEQVKEQVRESGTDQFGNIAYKAQKLLEKSGQ